MPTLTFLGGAGTVTGSRHLLSFQENRLLIDCGLFQGRKELRLKNWEPFPVNPASIGEVILTHAHIDHTGFLPGLVKAGFEGRVRCTRATADLCRILLPDTAHLQEEEARWANKKGYSKHSPALPLFTSRDAEAALQRFDPVSYGDHFHPVPGLRAKFRDTGHILGAGFLDLKWTRTDGSPAKLVFSGDLGRPQDEVLRPPATPYNVDYLVLESTYGDRLHDDADPRELLAQVVREAMDRGGVLVIPAFAVGRSQTLLHVLRELEEDGRIPQVPVYVDSPMALEALEVHRSHIADLNLQCRKRHLAGVDLFRTSDLRLTATPQQSMAINRVGERAIILSASGMAAGGRILHHLKERLPHERNTVLFIGYQAEGTRGRQILDGRDHIRMFGTEVPVRAQIESLSGFSGHADCREILAWLMGFNRPPRRIFLVHGEKEASRSLAGAIESRFGWSATPVEEGQEVDLE